MGMQAHKIATHCSALVHARKFAIPPEIARVLAMSCKSIATEKETPTSRIQIYIRVEDHYDSDQRTDTGTALRHQSIVTNRPSGGSQCPEREDDDKANPPAFGYLQTCESGQRQCQDCYVRDQARNQRTRYLLHLVGATAADRKGWLDFRGQIPSVPVVIDRMTLKDVEED